MKSETFKSEENNENSQCQNGFGEMKRPKEEPDLNGEINCKKIIQFFISFSRFGPL